MNAKLHRIVDGATFSGEAHVLEAMARTWWPRSVTEFGPVVVEGRICHRTLFWEDRATKDADVDGERVCGILAG